MRMTLVRMASGWIACLVLAAVAPAGRAALILNAEPNNTFATAQLLPPLVFTLDFDATIGTGAGGGFVNTSTSLPHVTILRPGTGQTTANLDYFRFTTALPGILVADIDNTPQATNFDTFLHLFTGGGVLLASSDDNNGDPGDGPGLIGGTFNSRIQTGILPPGDYVVAVSQFPSTAMTGGGVTNTVPAGGSYTLHISAQSGVPEPGALTLLGMGVVGLMGYASWRRCRTA